MQTSNRGLALIKLSEGLRLHTYQDSVGFPTIGYGHKLRAGEVYANGINLNQAIALLVEDVALAEQAIARLVQVPITQGQFDALVDFTFNLGAGRLDKSTLLQKVNERNYELASAEILKWDHAGHIELEALKVRRAAEYNMWIGRG